MKEEEILDAPSSIPSKTKIWRITFFGILWMILSLLIDHAFVLLNIDFSQQFIYHYIFFLDLIAIGVPLYFFIKRIDLLVYNFGVIFIWASIISTIGFYLSSIFRPAVSYICSIINPDLIHIETTLNLQFYSFFLKVSFLHGGVLSLGIYFLIKNNNYWFLPLIVLALWVLCNFFQIPYIIDF